MATGYFCLLFGGGKSTRLSLPQLGVVPILFQQLIVRALFHHSAFVHNQQPVHCCNGRQAVCNHDGRPIL